MRRFPTNHSGDKVTALNLPYLHEELTRRIVARTGTRVHKLQIQFSPEGIILLGETASYYIKQLAQHGILEALPEANLQNRITVAEPNLILAEPHFSEDQPN
jgi:hypothetical protein